MSYSHAAVWPETTTPRWPSSSRSPARRAGSLLSHAARTSRYAARWRAGVLVDALGDPDEVAGIGESRQVESRHAARGRLGRGDHSPLGSGYLGQFAECSLAFMLGLYPTVGYKPRQSCIAISSGDEHHRPTRHRISPCRAHSIRSCRRHPGIVLRNLGGRPRWCRREGWAGGLWPLVVAGIPRRARRSDARGVDRAVLVEPDGTIEVGRINHRKELVRTVGVLPVDGDSILLTESPQNLRHVVGPGRDRRPAGG